MHFTRAPTPCRHTRDSSFGGAWWEVESCVRADSIPFPRSCIWQALLREHIVSVAPGEQPGRRARHLANPTTHAGAGEGDDRLKDCSWEVATDTSGGVKLRMSVASAVRRVLAGGDSKESKWFGACEW